MTRSLSPTEARLILRLEWAKRSIVTIPEAMAILDVSYGHARQILHRLTQHKWLARITPGKYELIPAERGEHAFVDTNPLFIGSALIAPYQFSFATAAFFHGLSTQAAATVYIATTAGRPRLLTVRGKDYRLIVQPRHKFFGASEVDAHGSRVTMADPAKTLLDSLDYPHYAGGLPEVAAMLVRGKGQLDWARLADYAVRFKSRALVQRLGYLADALEVPLKPAVRRALLKHIGRATTYLGTTRAWGKGGTYNSVWQVVDNIPRRELLAEIQVR